MRQVRFSISDVAFAVFLWALMIAKYGYIYGSSDHEELLVYVTFLRDSSLYLHDFFVQSLHGSLPNERTVMTGILLPFGGHLSITVLLFHFFNTVLIILAFVRIATRFINSRYAAWFAVFISFFVLYNRGLGGVDAYSQAFQASDLGSMIAAWALLLFIDRRYILSSVVLSLGTFVHVLVGFDLIVVLGGIVLWRSVIDKELSFRTTLAFFGIYMSTAGVYLILVYLAKAKGNGTIGDEELFNIMFAFRHPHHFIFAGFPLITKVLFIIYTLWGLCFYRSRSSAIFIFFTISLAILVVYIIATDYGHWVFLASFQWYKITQWLKFFGVVAIVATLYQYVESYVANDRSSLNNVMLGLGLVAGISVFYLWANGTISEGYKQGNENEIAFSKNVRKVIGRDATFIQPFSFTAFKFYAQRSSYIDFKAIAKNKKDMHEWYRRIQEVYGLDYHMPEKGFQLEQKANSYYDNMSEAQLQKLHNEGVTHMIATSARYRTTHKLILADHGYFVYEL